MSENKLVKTVTDASVLIGLSAGVGYIAKKAMKESFINDPSSSIVNYGKWVAVLSGSMYLSSGKSRVHEGRRIAFKTRFFNFPIQSETKKHHWDRILQFRFHGTILGGLIQAAEKAGLTKVVQLRSKRVF